MNKKIYLLIIWLITLAVIIFAGYKAINNNNYLNMFHISINHNDKDWDKIDDEDDDFNFIGNSYVIDKDLDAFDKIIIDGSVMGVSVKPGIKYSICCAFSNEKLVPDVEVKKNTLYITQHSMRNNNKSRKSTVEITIPADVFIKEIDADVNVGAFEIEDLKFGKAKITNNVGAVSVKDSDFDDVDLRSNVGAIEIKLLDKKQKNYNWDLSTSVGGITVKNQNYHRSFKENNHASKTIKAESNVGAIDIK